MPEPVITIECLICEESIKTHDVSKAIAFDREHTKEHATTEETR